MPDVNIDEALASAAYETRALSASHASAVSPDRPQLPRQASESISEVVPAQADGFDWQEDVNDLADGMAALSVEPTGTGYLGMVVCGAPPYYLRTDAGVRLYCWCLLSAISPLLARPPPSALRSTGANRWPCRGLRRAASICSPRPRCGICPGAAEVDRQLFLCLSQNLPIHSRGHVSSSIPRGHPATTASVMADAAAYHPGPWGLVSA